MLPAIKTFSSKYFFHNSGPGEPVFGRVRREQQSNRTFSVSHILAIEVLQCLFFPFFQKKKKKENVSVYTKIKIKSRFNLQFLCNATVGRFQISLPSWCYNKFRVSSLFADQASVPAPVCIYLNSRAKRTVRYSVLALRQSDRRNCGLCVGLYAESGAAPLSFKRATTMPNKLIDSQHYKQLRRKTLTAFHLLLHFTLTTTQFNLLPLSVHI